LLCVLFVCHQDCCSSQLIFLPCVVMLIAHACPLHIPTKICLGCRLYGSWFQFVLVSVMVHMSILLPFENSLSNWSFSCPLSIGKIPPVFCSRICIVCIGFSLKALPHILFFVVFWFFIVFSFSVFSVCYFPIPLSHLFCPFAGVSCLHYPCSLPGGPCSNVGLVVGWLWVSFLVVPVIWLLGAIEFFIRFFACIALSSCLSSASTSFSKWVVWVIMDT